MKKTNETIIIDDKDVLTLFKNTLEKINQIMKKTNGETNGYIIDYELKYEETISCISTCPKQIPRTIETNITENFFNKKQYMLLNENIILFEDLYINDTQRVFRFLKDFKKEINSIEVYNDKLIIKAGLNELIIYKGKHFIEKFLKNNIEIFDDVFTYKIEDDILKEFLNKKGIFSMYFDIDNCTACFDKPEEDNDSIIKIIISSKYMTGLSELKENDEIYFIIYKSEKSSKEISYVGFEIIKKGIDIENRYLILNV